MLERVSAGPGRPSARLLRARDKVNPPLHDFAEGRKNVASWLDGVLYVVILRAWLVDFAVEVPPPNLVGGRRTFPTAELRVLI